MDSKKAYFLEVLDFIDCGSLSYDEWIKLGQSLHYEGLGVEIWDSFSRTDSARYVEGECERKWLGFGQSGTNVTGATITMMAKQNGYRPKGNEGHAYTWEDFGDPKPVITEAGDPIQDMIKYLNIMFESQDIIGYCCESTLTDKGKWEPCTKGVYSRNAGEMIAALKKCGGDITDAIGSYNQEAGVWIRVNPLDGAGCANKNVSEFRHVLIESDCLPIDKQIEVYQRLNLPITALVHSGGKSAHAIVKIQADNKEEYATRVRLLYEVCTKNGLKLDPANKNPSRLSRLPGVERGSNRQYLMGSEMGAPGWESWVEWYDQFADDLPDTTGVDFDEIFNSEMETYNQSGEIVTGFKSLDDIIGKLRPSLMPVAGGTSIGKTTLMYQIADQIAASGNHVLFFTLEMDPFILKSKSLARIASAKNCQTGLTSFEIRQGFTNQFVEKARKKYVETIGNYMTLVKGRFGYKVLEIERKIRTFKMRYGVTPIVFIDYLQVLGIEDTRKSDKQKIDEIIGELKRITEELQVTIFLISAINRSSYEEPVNCASFKESGSIEFTADILLGVQLAELTDYIPEPGNPAEKKKEKSEAIEKAKSASTRIIDVVVLKNRNGSIGQSVRFEYQTRFDKYVEFVHAAAPKTQQEIDKEFENKSSTMIIKKDLSTKPVRNKKVNAELLT